MRLYPSTQLTYLDNVANEKARLFYTQRNTEVLQPAFEQIPQKNEAVMFSRYCIKYAINACPRETKVVFGFREPLYLTNSRVHLRLDFDCEKCEMRIFFTY